MNEAKNPVYEIESNLEQIRDLSDDYVIGLVEDTLYLFRCEFIYPKRPLEVHPNQMRLF